MKKLILLLALLFSSCIDHDIQPEPTREEPNLIGSHWSLSYGPGEGKDIYFYREDSLKITLTTEYRILRTEFLPYVLDSSKISVQSFFEMPFKGEFRGDTLIFQEEPFIRAK